MGFTQSFITCVISALEAAAGQCWFESGSFVLMISSPFTLPQGSITDVNFLSEHKPPAVRKVFVTVLLHNCLLRAFFITPDEISSAGCCRRLDGSKRAARCRAAAVLQGCSVLKACRVWQGCRVLHGCSSAAARTLQPALSSPLPATQSSRTVSGRNLEGFTGSRANRKSMLMFNKILCN